MIRPVLKYLLFIALLPALAGGCDDNYRSSIPNVPVYMELNLTAQYPIFKNSTNQSLTFIKGKTTGVPESAYTGFGGLLVYTGLDSEYYAFDMACPYEAEPTVRVYPNETGQAICEKCGSVYEIGFGIGNPSSGPAKEVLKRYRTSFNGHILLITSR